MRWLLIFVTGLALMFSACGRMGTGERIAVVNWEKALEGHSRYLELQSRKDAYNLLVDKRREQELVARTHMGSLAKLQQLKMRSKQNYFSADFMARMAEKQAAGQEEMKKLSNRLADEVDKELADEERKLNEKYRLEIFNLRLKLDTIRMMPEERSRLEARLKAVQTARDRDRMALVQYKIGLVNRRMEPHVKAMRQKMDEYARQLQAQMMAELKKDEQKDTSVLQKAPGALKEMMGTVDQELDRQQQDIESLETSIKKDIESVIIKLAKERGYTVVFHKYRTNVSAEDITADVVAGLKKLEVRAQAAGALSKKAPGTTDTDNK